MKTNKNKIGTILVVVATLILAGVAIFTAIRLYQLRQQPVAPSAPTSQPKASVSCTTAANCQAGQACINDTCQTTACTLTFSLPTPSPTPSPTPVPQCNTVCTSSSQCPANLTCNIPAGATTGNCRNAACKTDVDCICATPTPTPTPTSTPTPTPTPTKTPTHTPTLSPTPTPTPPPGCNGACTSDSQCPSGMSCYITSGTTGSCRNPSCQTSTNCICATPTPAQTPNPTGTPLAVGTPPALPESGINLPTYVGAGIGIFVLLASILLAI